MSPIEISATVFGFICVFLTIRQNIWCWPTGLVQVLLYIHVFYLARLYSDMGLHVIYVFMQIYGWVHWRHGGRDRGPLEVSLLGAWERLFWATAGILATLALGYAMDNWTDADLPYWDAATTILSLIAQWLMAKKVLESWIFWIAVDVMAIGVYAAKALYPTSILYATFLIMAVTGFFTWKKSLKPA